MVARQQHFLLFMAASALVGVPPSVAAAPTAAKLPLLGPQGAALCSGGPFWPSVHRCRTAGGEALKTPLLTQTPPEMDHTAALKTSEAPRGGETATGFIQGIAREVTAVTPSPRSPRQLPFRPDRRKPSPSSFPAGHVTCAPHPCTTFSRSLISGRPLCITLRGGDVGHSEQNFVAANVLPAATVKNKLLALLNQGSTPPIIFRLAPITEPEPGPLTSSVCGVFSPVSPELRMFLQRCSGKGR